MLLDYRNFRHVPLASQAGSLQLSVSHRSCRAVASQKRPRLALESDQGTEIQLPANPFGPALGFPQSYTIVAAFLGFLCSVHWGLGFVQPWVFGFLGSAQFDLGGLGAAKHMFCFFILFLLACKWTESNRSRAPFSNFGSQMLGFSRGAFPNRSREPKRNSRFLKRTMVEKNGLGIVVVPFCHARFGSTLAKPMLPKEPISRFPVLESKAF